YPISKPSGWPSTACGRRWDIVDVCDEDPTVPCPRVADGVDRVAVLVRGGALELSETLTPVNTKKPRRRTGRLRSYGLCGAMGIRTPDLLHAMEARYQLRHSPWCAGRFPRSAMVLLYRMTRSAWSGVHMPLIVEFVPV